MTARLPRGSAERDHVTKRSMLTGSGGGASALVSPEPRTPATQKSELPTGVRRFSTRVIASSSSTEASKTHADYTCTGSRDDPTDHLVFQQAIDELTAEINATWPDYPAHLFYGEIKVLEGSYFFGDTVNIHSIDLDWDSSVPAPGIRFVGTGMDSVFIYVPTWANYFPPAADETYGFSLESGADGSNIPVAFEELTMRGYYAIEDYGNGGLRVTRCAIEGRIVGNDGWQIESSMITGWIISEGYGLRLANNYLVNVSVTNGADLIIAHNRFDQGFAGDLNIAATDRVVVIGNLLPNTSMLTVDRLAVVGNVLEGGGVYNETTCTNVRRAGNVGIADA